MQHETKLAISELMNQENGVGGGGGSQNLQFELHTHTMSPQSVRHKREEILSAFLIVFSFLLLQLS